jgi:ubiquinone/menaquinone biosynthesis C-methylase UbiE
MEILPRNVKKENIWQYQSPNAAGEAVPFTADVRRHLYLKYALEPARLEAGERPRDLWDEMAAKLDDLKGEKIADIGTGNAYFIDRLLNRGHMGPIYGYDTSASHLDIIEQSLINKYSQLKPEVHLEYGDGQRLPVEKNYFKAAVSPFLIYHLPRPWKLLQEMSRVVVPGGLIIISGRGIENTWNLWEIAEMTASAHNAKMPPLGAFYSHLPLNDMREMINNHKRMEELEYVEQDDTIWIPDSEDGWNDYREAIFSLLPLMRLSNGRHLSKTDVLDFLESNQRHNVRRDIFTSLANEHGGYFPDKLTQGFVVAKNTKRK